MNPIALFLRPFLPWATEWVLEQEKIIIRDGRPLIPTELADARLAGVLFPEKIHILAVPTIQPPRHWLLLLASKFVPLIGPQTAGLTLNYGIYLRKDCSNYRANRNLYVHEFVHVGQYERLGVYTFLAAYLVECIHPGYPLGPMEQEAILKAREITKK